jgi:general secretion pathway protein A
MYENHFGFTIKPFQTIPNPEVFYPSPKHENALTYLEYGLMERTGFILLTGEIGSGKTTLIKHLINKFESEIDIAVIFNTNVTSEQLIGLILNEFELGLGIGSKADALDILYQFLINKFAHNRRVLLVIDEAQNLSRDALEEVRMLSNLQSDDQMLLQIMLVGQPELRTRIRKPNLAQLNQRITVAYHLPALTREETEGYITFRIKKAGGKPGLFTREAIDLIHETSMGIPRTINIICDTALVYAYADDLENINAPIIQQVIDDREGTGLSYHTAGIADQKNRHQDSSALSQKIDALENNLSKFQMHVTTRLGDLEMLSHEFRNELVTQLKGQYERERIKNEKILIEYNKLKDKYIGLLKKMKLKEKPEAHVQANDDGVVEQAKTSHLNPMTAENLEDMQNEIRKRMDAALNDLRAPNAARAKKKEPGTKKSTKKTPVESNQAES